MKIFYVTLDERRALLKALKIESRFIDISGPSPSDITIARYPTFLFRVDALRADPALAVDAGL